MAGAVRAAALQGFDGLVRAFGGQPERLIRECGLRPESLRDPESMIPLNSVAELLEEAATGLAQPAFGLLLGGQQDPTMLGQLAVVIQDSATVYHALRTASRYLYLHSPAYDFALDDYGRQLPGCISVRFDVNLEGAVPQRQLIDGCLSSAHRLTQLLSPIPFRLKGVSLPHSPIAGHADYRSHFCAQVFFEQPYAALHLDREILGTSMQRIKPELRERAIAYVASREPANASSVSARVRSALKSTMGANRGTKAEIAGLLGLEPRTLQRRLTAEGETFDGIRNQVYRAAAWRLLRETNIPLSQVAAAVGLSEQSALTRVVRRWFDATPTEIRNGQTLSSRG